LAGDINPISFLKLFRMNRPVLAKMTLIAGCLQIAHEGKSVQPLFSFASSFEASQVAAQKHGGRASGLLQARCRHGV